MVRSTCLKLDTESDYGQVRELGDEVGLEKSFEADIRDVYKPSSNSCSPPS